MTDKEDFDWKLYEIDREIFRARSDVFLWWRLNNMLNQQSTERRVKSLERARRDLLKKAGKANG